MTNYPCNNNTCDSFDINSCCCNEYNFEFEGSRNTSTNNNGVYIGFNSCDVIQLSTSGRMFTLHVGDGEDDEGHEEKDGAIIGLTIIIIVSV
jgi:hypothetical protein